MRILLLVMAALFVAGSAHAQEQYIELLRSDLRADKVAIVTEVMQFTEEQGTVFWPLYRKYDLELSALGDKRLALIKDYAKNFDNMTDEKANKLMATAFDVQEKRTKLRKKYYKEVGKALSPIVAAKFIQLENQIGLLIDLQIAAEMPLIKRGPEATPVEN